MTENTSTWRRWLPLAAAVLFSAGVAVYWYAPQGGKVEAEVKPAASRERPRPPASEFVGSARCADCHDEIHAHYSKHPMAHTLAALPDPREADKPDRASFDPGGRCVYEVVRTASGWDHTEIIRGTDGAELARRTLPVHYAIGSGIRGRSYLIELGDRLLQSPISWFTSIQKFALSPGYEPDGPLGFRRNVVDGCLACHSGRAADLPGTDQRYGKPIVLEASIGCERCHGPGRQHVAAREQSDPEPGKPDPTIINPKHLSNAQQEAICYQCHLSSGLRIARYGCNEWSFQPGQKLEDVLTIFIQVEEGISKPSKVVSHVSQMLASRCYIESGKKLQCTTCHDAHAVPEASEKAAWYRSKCLTCHTSDACSVEEPVRRTEHPDDNCTACHMPKLTEQDVAHVAQTDHRIIRRKGQQVAVPPWRTEYGFTFFNNAQEGLPEWEIDRALGLALASKMRREFDPDKAQQAKKHLQRALPHVPDDYRVLGELAELDVRLGDTETAFDLLQRGLKRYPENEYLVSSMVTALYRVGMYFQALPYCDRLAKLDPTNDTIYLTKAMLLHGLDRTKEALALGEHTIKLNPRNLQARQWLVKTYLEAGRPADAQRHIEFLRRFAGR